MTEACCVTKDAQKPVLQLYKPVIVPFLLSLAVGSALHLGTSISFGDAAMAFFLCLLSALKFFNLAGFTEAFAKYDIVAARFTLYARAYPFIELGLACLYFSRALPILTNLLTLTVMIVGMIGIINAIRSGQKVQCACVGTGFDLPVGRVTLLENAAMGMMALINLLTL